MKYLNNSVIIISVLAIFGFVLIFGGDILFAGETTPKMGVRRNPHDIDFEAINLDINIIEQKSILFYSKLEISVENLTEEKIYIYGILIFKDFENGGRAIYDNLLLDTGAILEPKGQENSIIVVEYLTRKPSWSATVVGNYIIQEGEKMKLGKLVGDRQEY